MPNYCDYEMKIIGSKDNVLKAISYVQVDYGYDRLAINDNTLKYCTADKHLYRVFEAEVLDINDENGPRKSMEDLLEKLDDGNYVGIISGYYAWSIHACMFDGGSSYYSSHSQGDDKATTIPLISEELGLDIEIFSAEPGMGFMEHYLVKSGEVEISDCVEFEETENEETGEYVTTGGLEWNYTI